MTRLDVGPEDVAAATDCAGPMSVMLEAREVPLGGVRAMEVHRLLPQRSLPMVGAWCFLDRFGPQAARMRVLPHPHIGLQTVTWPFEGDIHHRDSVGSDVVVARGALNLMTSGAGISHSEFSVGEGEIPLDALQLWVALPDGARTGAPSFERHENLPIVALFPVTDVAGTTDSSDPAGDATVVMGEFGGVSSPATVHTPIVGAELRVPAGARVRVPLRPDFEHALVGAFGEVAVDASAGLPANAEAAASDSLIAPQRMLYLGTQRDHIDLFSEGGATVFLLGGEPFPDEIVMWWNFVGRTHDEIVEAREEWEARSSRFGAVEGHGDERIPAPPLPAIRLTPRRRQL